MPSKLSTMQNRNFFKVFAIVFSIVCLYQLSFTWVADSIESDADNYAMSFSPEEYEDKYRLYLDSISGEKVYDILIAEYTYSECKQREINLGLDLKGGMNVTLEVMVVDVIKALSNNSKDEKFNLAISNALKLQSNSQEDFVTLFGNEYEKIAPAPNSGLAGVFSTPDLREKINFSSTNQQVLDLIRVEVEDAINRSFNILRSRIDRFGVTQPNIQRLETAGRILVELPGIKDTERARKLLQSTAQLEFWETYEYQELFPQLEEINQYLREIESEDNNLDSEKVSSEISEEPSNQLADVVEEISDTLSTSLLDQIDDSLSSDTTNSLTFE